MFRTVLFHAFVVSSSMEPLLTEGDRVIARRLGIDQVERGDIVIFQFSENPSELFIKRVIGLPGDMVEITYGGVYVNGEYYAEDYLKESMKVSEERVYNVPEGCYFVMGDNRNNSYDSREIKDTYVKQEAVVAVAAIWYYPFSKFGIL